MPELAELKIMADYINHGAKEKKFKKIYHVEKGNIPKVFSLAEGEFQISAESNGKELLLYVYHDVASFKISVFMGMSGNWLWLPTKDWNDRSFVRLRLDAVDGTSLLLYGLYMGPKYKVGGFATKRGPDPTKDFLAFKKNIDAAVPGLNDFLFILRSRLRMFIDTSPKSISTGQGVRHLWQTVQ